MPNLLIIAGKGSLPEMLKNKIPDALVVGFDDNMPQMPCDLITNFAQVGRIIEFAKHNNVSKVIMAGGMKKPDLKKIKPDAEGALLLAKIAAGKFFGGAGDDYILRKVIEHLELRKLAVIGVQEILPEIIASKGAITDLAPNRQQMADIEAGLKAAKELGEKDVGQAVVVEDGIIIATEDDNGTENLIARAGKLKKSYGGVLVKAAKPQQDKRVDLPSIGLETISQLATAGISGVAIEAGESLLLDKDKMPQLAKNHNIFVFGY